MGAPSGRRPLYAAGRHNQMVRWPKDLHERLCAGAEAAGLSFSEYVVGKMAEAEGYQPELARYDDSDQLAIGA